MDYHVLDSSTKLTRSRVAFHISVPNEDNSVGVNLRNALLLYKGTPTSIVPNLETDFPVEWANLQNGSIYEHGEVFVYSNANFTPLQKRAEIDARFLALEISVVNYLRKILKYYGLNRDVS